MASDNVPLDAAVPLDPALQLDFPAEERIASQETLDALRLIALGLVGLTVLVSAVGVAVTLSLSVLERTRESGVLRALACVAQDCARCSRGRRGCSRSTRSCPAWRSVSDTAR